MRYRKYEQAMQRLSSILKWFYRRRALLLSSLALLILLTAAYGLLAGRAINDLTCSSVTYGEPLCYQVKTLFSKVEYRFLKKGEAGYLKEEPLTAGEYEVHAFAKTLFGERKVDAVCFTISPMPLEISFLGAQAEYMQTDALVNDRSLLKIPDLAYQDSVSSCTLRFSTTEAGTHEAGILLEDLRIVDSRGEDVTFCYMLCSSSGELTVKKRQLLVFSGDESKEYDGTLFKGSVVTVDEDTPLAPGHQAKAIFLPTVHAAPHSEKNVFEFFVIKR